MIKAEIQEIRNKRTETLIGVWDAFIRNKIIGEGRFKLSIPLIDEIVEHYLDDLEILKYRYKIEQRIHLCKIAGLMTSLILKYRPIIFLFEEYDSNCKLNEDLLIEPYINELYAIFHGLSVCSNNSTSKEVNIIKEKWFYPWLKDFLYLLHCRNYTAESLIFIYETLSFFKFPENLNFE